MSAGKSLVDSPEKIFETSDFVSIHCPAIPKNRHLVNADRLASMKTTAFLINPARSHIADEATLVNALRSKKIAGAGLNVFEQEPNVTDALFTMENAVLLPHLGGATTETLKAMGFRAS